MKISINCDFALGRPDFHLPSLEDIHTYIGWRISDCGHSLAPNFTAVELMKDVSLLFGSGVNSSH